MRFLFDGGASERLYPPAVYPSCRIDLRPFSPESPPNRQRRGLTFRRCRSRLPKNPTLIPSNRFGSRRAIQCRHQIGWRTADDNPGARICSRLTEYSMRPLIAWPGYLLPALAVAGWDLHPLLAHRGKTRAGGDQKSGRSASGTKQLLKMQVGEEDGLVADDVPDPCVFSAHTASGHSPCARR
jgi:hypothetical protein